MVEEVSIDDAVDKVTYSIIQAADMAIPKTSGKIPKIWKPWWNEECRIFNKQQKKARDKFRRYPSTSNLIDFNWPKQILEELNGRVRGNHGKHSLAP
ncbi:hypothetical protein AVEN_91661-1 [Araneus ventricosus]|uniref:Uncharacterized protein n=1 Tax=Araneus ventricosus TaxID=182803 RepID=A0A4Y2IUF7_ARAVE|nr:hypothetical protein AVEN_91661-1 [Araneus ventricosus]